MEVINDDGTMARRPHLEDFCRRFGLRMGTIADLKSLPDAARSLRVMGRLAVVTGASRGIGAAVSRAFVERGISVLGVARSKATLSHALYRHVRLDLSEPKDVQAFFEGPFRRLTSHVDADEVILVNNSATIGSIDHLESQPLNGLCRESVLNAIVPAWLMGFISRCFVTRPVRIINISSGAADRPYAGWTSYCSGKAALLMASRVFAEEQALVRAQRGGPLRSVVCLAPGSVDTDIQDSIRDVRLDAFPDLEKFHRLKRNGSLFSAGEIAEVIARLVEADHGQVFRNLRCTDRGYLKCLECGQRFSTSDIDHGCARGSASISPLRKSA